MRPTITTIVTTTATIITTTSSTSSLQPSTLNPQPSTLALKHHPITPHSAHPPLTLIPSTLQPSTLNIHPHPFALTLALLPHSYALDVRTACGTTCWHDARDGSVIGTRWTLLGRLGTRLVPLRGRPLLLGGCDDARAVPCTLMSPRSPCRGLPSRHARPLYVAPTTHGATAAPQSLAVNPPQTYHATP